MSQFTVSTISGSRLSSQLPPPPLSYTPPHQCVSTADVKVLYVIVGIGETSRPV